MRLLVTGGRDYSDFQALRIVLDQIHKEHPVTLLIHGGARGADTLAGRWAESNGVPTAVYRAQWKEHGKAAGPIRNQKMLTDAKPTTYLAFPGGRGTADMVCRCQKAGIPDAKAPKIPHLFLNPRQPYF